MDIEFNCDKCGQVLIAAEDTEGREAECPKCNASINLPLPEKKAATEEESENQSPPRKKIPMEQIVDEDQKEGLTLFQWSYKHGVMLSCHTVLHAMGDSRFKGKLIKDDRWNNMPKVLTAE